MTEFHSFDSPKGRQLLREMREQGLSTASVPLNSPEGMRYYQAMQQALRQATGLEHDASEEDR